MLMPAQLIRISSAPSASAVFCTAPFAAAGCDTSVTSLRSLPAKTDSAASRSSPAASTSTPATCAPAPASARAITRPMPLAAPVTSATRPASPCCSAMLNLRHGRWQIAGPVAIACAVARPRGSRSDERSPSIARDDLAFAAMHGWRLGHPAHAPPQRQRGAPRLQGARAGAGGRPVRRHTARPRARTVRAGRRPARRPEAEA